MPKKDERDYVCNQRFTILYTAIKRLFAQSALGTSRDVLNISRQWNHHPFQLHEYQALVLVASKAYDPVAGLRSASS